jgi:transcriptional regulator with XRE-family HTH domain
VERLHFRKVFGEAIRAYRENAGLTQEKLAERADMHHNFIGEVERGKHGVFADVNAEDFQSVGGEDEGFGG